MEVRIRPALAGSHPRSAAADAVAPVFWNLASQDEAPQASRRRWPSYGPMLRSSAARSTSTATCSPMRPSPLAGQGLGRRRRQALPSGRAHAVAVQVLRHRPEQRAMRIQPLRHRLQLAADLVPGKDIEYAGLDGAFLAHCRLRRWRFCFGISGLIPECTRNRRGSPAKNRDPSNKSRNLAFVDGH